MSATVIVGGDDSLLKVRHIRLAGSQSEIGRALAAAAHRAHGEAVIPLPIDRVRRRWFERNYPTLFERRESLQRTPDL